MKKIILLQQYKKTNERSLTMKNKNYLDTTAKVYLAKKIEWLLKQHIMNPIKFDAKRIVWELDIQDAAFKVDDVMSDFDYWLLNDAGFIKIDEVEAKQEFQKTVEGIKGAVIHAYKIESERAAGDESL